MSENERFKKAVEYVRKVFFPRWDSERKWVFKFDDNLPVRGFCENKKRTITIRPSKDEEGLLEILIHEICHSSCPHHGNKFLERLTKKAEVAKKIGKNSLAKKLLKDVEICKNARSLSPSIVYDVFSAWTRLRPDLSFDEMLKLVAHECGMYPKILEERYKQVKKIWEKTKSAIIDIEKLHF